MLCEHAQYSQDDGKLAVSGYVSVRGAPLSADRLVHIPGLGDFQVSNLSPGVPIKLKILHSPFGPFVLKI